MPGPKATLIDSLLGDMSLNEVAAQSTGLEPWLSFERAKAFLLDGDADKARTTLEAIGLRPGVEARCRAQAWHVVRQIGGKPPGAIEREVLGVVVEVGMQDGLDLLAAYADHAARYYNYSGAGVVWMRPDSSLDGLIDALLSAGRAVVTRVAPWKGARRPAPPTGNARLNVISPLGIHFGEGSLEVLSQDSLAGPLVRASINLMAKLTSLPRDP
jgi:hypothetical protein